MSYNELNSICTFVSEKIKTQNLTINNYISTENMIQNRGGVTKSSGLPTTVQTQSFKTGDVLVSNIRPYFKKIWLANRYGGCSNDILVFRANKNINAEFLYYVLSDNEFFDYATKTAKGTKMPRGDKKAIMLYEVPNIDIETQIAIANVLRKIDLKIELNNKINDNLEQQAQAIFKSWFVDFEPFGGIMPSDWENKPLFDFAEFINGTAFKKNEYTETGLPIVKIAELKNGITSSTQYFNGSKDAKYNIFNGDILFSWSGNPLTSIDIFVWDKGNAILNQHTFKVINYDGLQHFMYLMLKHFKKEFCDIASHKQTTGLGHVTVTDLKRLKFHYSKEVLSRFDYEVAPLLKKKFALNIENQKLAQLRDTLLPKLMSGEIDVSQVEI